MEAKCYESKEIDGLYSMGEFRGWGFFVSNFSNQQLISGHPDKIFRLPFTDVVEQNLFKKSSIKDLAFN